MTEFIYQQPFFEPWHVNYTLKELEAWLVTLQQTNQLLYIFDGYDELRIKADRQYPFK